MHCNDDETDNDNREDNSVDELPHPEYLKFGTVGNGQRPDIVLANSNAAQRPMYVTSTTIIIITIIIIIINIITITIIIITDIVMFIMILQLLCLS